VKPSRLALVALVLVALAGVFAVACGDDDDGNGAVDVLSPESEPDPEADPDPEAEHDEAEAATPGPKPDGSTQVDVTLKEWEVAVSTDTVAAGEIYFLVENIGPEHAHEFVVVRSDAAVDDLPVDDGRVAEDDVDIVDEIEAFAVDSTASIALDLEPGAYVLICNLLDEGEERGHYELGMRTAFTVE